MEGEEGVFSIGLNLDPVMKRKEGSIMLIPICLKLFKKRLQSEESGLERQMCIRTRSRASERWMSLMLCSCTHTRQ